MKANYVDETGKSKPIMMGCYGIGLGRLMATVVEASHDKNGIIWPESIAPFQAHLLQIGEDSEVAKTAQEVYNKLLDNNIEILFDDRPEVTAGQKFADADLIGIPFRLVVSQKTKNKIEVKKRNEKDACLLSVAELLKILEK